ncbi:hypothetical protein COV87_03180 [Candidatus Roizmanbacteria bacterium CG11_big_fil_rev_8_21_14_0_20_37_16]|uniref:Gram-positive cocci surface proteins LPxTG domain-containing protein n=2 Tax=Candidatus Roizmaniibacteriota TaxID=1752723 RepID=A0A2H0KJQ8_9BACT|nr:MAG: hypothetical protein COV87_03180 [Candidatus Roizmanbacteria bacterium CG11_big_fil_rev_8_21_14_0_20_37_16]
MKKNKKLITGALLVMTVTLLAAIFYISSLLSSPNKSPTRIRKTKASAVTYKKEINLVDDFSQTPKPTLLVLAPTIIPTVAVPTKAPTKAPTTAPVILAQEPTDIPEPTKPASTPTLQPLLAYKSTSISPTLIPISPSKTPTPTKKIQPTGAQTLPETGWIQTSSLLFIVAMTTIFLSLLF